MRFSYYDLTEDVYHTTIDVLNSYGIKHETRIKPTPEPDTFFDYVKCCQQDSDVLYDVFIDVTLECFDFLKAEIQKAIEKQAEKEKTIQKLEDLYRQCDADSSNLANKRKHIEDILENADSIKQLKCDINDLMSECFPSVYSQIQKEKSEKEETRGTIIKYTDLNPQVKDLLLQKVPEKVLKSSRCKIYKISDTDYKVSIDNSEE